ncbi:MAG: VanZ family protein [Vicinamibacterales bacterium]
MLAESVGSIAGTALWLVVGRHVTDWLRAFSGEHERPALIQRLLLLYAVAFIASQMMPLDLTVSLGELARKYRHGAIVLRPFSFAHETWMAAAWDYLGDVALNAPLGAAAVFLWTAPGTRRRPVVALALATLVVGLIECGQVFVMSRYADVTDVLTGSVGVAVGVLLAGSLSTQPTSARGHGQPERLTLMSRLLIPVWVAVLASYHWAPYNFSLAPEQVTAGMHRLLQIPFLSYYVGTEFNAFTEMARKALLALPLGVLLGLAWPRGVRPALVRPRQIVLLAIAFVSLCGIEFGQVFLPTRYPDLTDAFIGEAGALAGLWIASLVSAPSRHRHVASQDADATPS